MISGKPDNPAKSALRSSWPLVLYFPFNESLRKPKNQKSQGEMSGEYGGDSIFLKPNLQSRLPSVENYVLDHCPYENPAF
jgi:hypothetical protein